MNVKTIKFTHHVSGYRVGEIAGFDDAIADRLVYELLAEYYVPEATAQPQDFDRPATQPFRPGEAESLGKAVEGPPAHRMVTGDRTVKKGGDGVAPGKARRALFAKGDA